jgi:DNA-binding GntR family transcriptional regulator
VTAESARTLDSIWKQAAQQDGLLPPERDLAVELGIGRNAVREALIRLEADGLVSRRHGAGTFANQAALEVPVRIDRTTEYAAILEGAGFEAAVEVLEAGWIRPSQDVLDRLRITPDLAVYRTRKRWLADGRPTMYAEDLIPAHRKVDVDPTISVYEIATTLGAPTTEWVCSWLDAALAGELSLALECTPSTPLLRFEQVGVGRNGSRCWLAFEHHNPAAGSSELRYGLVRTMTNGTEDPLEHADRSRANS